MYRGYKYYHQPPGNRTGLAAQTVYAYDSLIRFTSSTNALSGNTNLTYNPLDDVTGVKDQRNNTTTYTYNAFGDVVGEVSPNRGTIAYVVDKAGNVTKRTDARGVVTDYTWDALNRLTGIAYLNDAPLAQIDAGAPEVLTYLHPDHLGTPRYGTNTGGTQVWAANADAFGVGTPSGSATVNLRMPGQYYDSESGLFYNWNRYYSPVIGRYISSDPMGQEGGLNTFNYASVSPVMGPSDMRFSLPP